MARKHVALAVGVLVAAALVAVSAALATLRSEPRRPDARVFAAHVVELIAANRYDEAWTLLHPLHQTLAPRAEYVDCEAAEPIPGHLESVRVLREFAERTSLGTGSYANSEAVVLRIAIGGGPGAPVVITDTVHAVAVHGQWRWIMPPARVQAYSAGRCPDGSPPPSSPAA
jgi:hypothetical protein